jgi:hypothetical protein
MKGVAAMVTNPGSTNNGAGQLTLQGLALEVEHLPGQTEMFIKLLAEFVANQEDITGFRVDNLRLMAKSLKMSYQTIDSLLAMFDKFDKTGTREGDREKQS